MLSDTRPPETFLPGTERPKSFTNAQPEQTLLPSQTTNLPASFGPPTLPLSAPNTNDARRDRKAVNRRKRRNRTSARASIYDPAPPAATFKVVEYRDSLSLSLSHSLQCCMRASSVAESTSYRRHQHSPYVAESGSSFSGR